MNLEELEAERKKVLVQYLSFIFIFISIVVLICGFMSVISDLSKGAIMLFIVIPACAFVNFAFFYKTPKKFELKVKKIFFPSVLKDIVGKRGEIFWKNSLDCENGYERIEHDISLKLFDKTCQYDEIYYGHYFKTKFTNVEYDEFERCRRYSMWFIKGNVLEIPLNISYQNKLVIMDRKFFLSELWETKILYGLSIIDLNISFKNPKLKIFSDNIKEIEEVLTPEFVDFVNNLSKKMTLVVAKGNLYIISNSDRDKYKMGSLFRRIDDYKQSNKFRADLQEVLDIVERASTLKFVKKIDDVADEN